MASSLMAEPPLTENISETAPVREFELADLARPLHDWVKFAGPAFAIALLAATAWIVGRGDLYQLTGLVPRHPAFWGLIALYLAIPPLCDFVIFRRLWQLPATGIAALFRKNASNEILLGYLGEVQFYAWARQHARLNASPFGAVKDVAILSAMTGNAVTLLLLCMAWPFVGSLALGKATGPVLWSVAVLLGSSLVVGLFRNRILSLGRADCWYTTAVHLVRTVLSIVLLALLWHTVLPAIAPQWWLLMAAGRQLMTRLPFLPNKDLAFAGLATFLTGGVPGAPSAVLLVGTLLFAGWVAIGAALALSELAQSRLIRR